MALEGKKDRQRSSSLPLPSFLPSLFPSTPFLPAQVHSTLFRPSSAPIFISPVLFSGESELDLSSRPLPLKTPTRDRLIAWSNAPGGRGEIPGEIELGGMYLENLVTCGNVWPSHSLELEKNNQHLWRSLNRSTLHHHRTRLIDK